MSKVSFTPNTITYTAHGAEADKIKKSKVGVVVHTKYKGDDLHSMSAHHEVDHHNFKQHPDVHHHSAEKDLSKVEHHPEHEAQFEKHMAAAKHIHDTHGSTMYKHTSKHSGDAGHLATYANALIRNNEHPSAAGFQKHLTSHHEKKAQKVKTDAGQAKHRNEGKEHVAHVEKHKASYDHLLNMQQHLQHAKNALVKTLDGHEGKYEHHINGKKSKPEGYVVHHSDETGKSQPNKLVNRQEFAKANFEKNAKR